MDSLNHWIRQHALPSVPKKYKREFNILRIHVEDIRNRIYDDHTHCANKIEKVHVECNHADDDQLGHDHTYAEKMDNDDDDFDYDADIEI